MAPTKTTANKNKPAKCSRSQFEKDFFFKKKAGTKGNKAVTAETKGGFGFAWVGKAGSRNNEADRLLQVFDSYIQGVSAASSLTLHVCSATNL